MTEKKKFPSLKDIKAERTEPYRQKHARYEEYSNARAHDKELAIINANLRGMLDMGIEKNAKEKTL